MEILIATENSEIDACLNLRREVFILEQNVDEALEVDGEDDICKHYLMQIAGEPIAAGRVKPIGAKAKIQRISVKKSARGHGYGARLIEFMLADLSSSTSFETAILGSQVHAIEFYEKLGFTAFGPFYLDADIEHRDMTISLKTK